jgi:hypothetical protein
MTNDALAQRAERLLRAEPTRDSSSTMTPNYAEQVSSKDAIKAYKPIVT